MADTIRSAEIYAEQLSTRGRGIPLWYPEPSNGEDEVHFGDVGVLHNGGFLQLFNASVPADHPWNKKGVPDNFEPILDLADMLKEDHPNDIPRGVLESTSIKIGHTNAALQGQISGQPVGGELSYTFEINNRQGAMLILKDCAARKTILTHKVFRTYLKKNIERWCNFADRLGTEYKLEDFLFVAGWTKTTSWHVAAFYEHVKSRGVAIKGQIYGIVGANLSIYATAGDSPAMDQRSGPAGRPQLDETSATPESPDNPADQCIFLVAYRAKRRFGGLAPLKIYGAAGADTLPDAENDSNASGAVVADPIDEPTTPGDERQSGSFSFTGPCDAVLNYILNHSNAEMVIAAETDLDDLLLGRDWPDDVAKYLEEHLPKIEIEDGVGTLSLATAVRHARLHETQADAAVVDDDDVDDDYTMSQSAQSAPNIIEDGALVVRGGTAGPKTMSWPHVVLRDPSEDMRTLTCMSVSPTGPFLAAGSEEGHVGVWRYRAGRLEDASQQQDQPIWAVAMSQKGTKVASGGAEKIGLVWDIEDSTGLSVLEGHQADIVAITWSRNEKFVATGSVDCSARLWDPTTGVCLHVLEGHEGTVLVVEFSPDSTRLVTFAETVGHVWDTTTGAQVATLNGHGSTVWALAFSPDSARIATCSEDGTSRIWSADQGEELVTFHEHGGPVYCIAFSPDGRDIATGSFDETLVVCDSYSAERRHNFDRHSSSVNSIAYSHSGRLIASGSTDGNVKVWDTVLDDYLVEFQGHDDKVKGLAFSPDDRDIVSASEDGTVRVWCLRDALRFV